MSSVWQDIRYALRGLIKHKAFSCVAVVSLALGIGANTAIFSVIDAVMLRSLPVANPDELVVLGVYNSIFKRSSFGFSYPFYRELREVARGVSGSFVSSRPADFDVSFASGQDSLSREPLAGVAVSGEYFETLGLSPRVGRVLGPQDDEIPGGHPVAVISSEFWPGVFRATRVRSAKRSG